MLLIVTKSSLDSESAVKVLHTLLFGEWTMVEKEMLQLGNSRLEDTVCVFYLIVKLLQNFH